MYAVVESLEFNTHVGTFDMSIQYQDNLNRDDDIEVERNNEDDNDDRDIEVELNEANVNDNEAEISTVTIQPPPPFELVFSRNTSLVDVRISSPSSVILASVFRGLALNSSVRILQVGEMSAMGITTSMNADCATQLQRMLERNRSIHRLALQGFHWDEAHALKSVANGLRRNKSLRVLELLQIMTTTAQNQGDCDGDNSTNLMMSIITMKNLKRLSIIGCELPDMSFNVAIEDAASFKNVSGLNMEVDIPLITSIPCVSKRGTDKKMEDIQPGDSESDAQDHPRLEELRLVECALSGPAIQSLQRGWEHHSFLRILDLRSNSLEDDSCHAIAEVLNTAKSLTKVILEDNIIGDDGLTILSRNGLNRNTTLKTMCLKENNFGPSGVQVLADALQYNQCLDKLDLSYNYVADEGATALGTMLSRNRALRELVLESTSIGGLGVSGLVSSLKLNNSLYKLNISGNLFGETGVQALSALLTEGEDNACPLKSLRLSSCQLGDLGVAAIATALVSNTSLEEIVMPFNRFGDVGADAIGQLIPKWKGLESLQIQFNLFSEIGFEKIVKGLSMNYYLKSMYLLNAGPSNRKIDHLFQEMQHWIRLNRGGRQVLNEPTMSPALWPLVLAKADRAYSLDALHFLLTQRPDVVCSRAS